MKAGYINMSQFNETFQPGWQPNFAFKKLRLLSALLIVLARISPVIFHRRLSKHWPRRINPLALSGVKI